MTTHLNSNNVTVGNPIGNQISDRNQAKMKSFVKGIQGFIEQNNIQGSDALKVNPNNGKFMGEVFNALTHQHSKATPKIKALIDGSTPAQGQGQDRVDYDSDFVFSSLSGGSFRSEGVRLQRGASTLELNGGDFGINSGITSTTPTVGGTGDVGPVMQQNSLALTNQKAAIYLSTLFANSYSVTAGSVASLYTIFLRELENKKELRYDELVVEYILTSANGVVQQALPTAGEGPIRQALIKAHASLIPYMNLGEPVVFANQTGKQLINLEQNARGDYINQIMEFDSPRLTYQASRVGRIKGLPLRLNINNGISNRLVITSATNQIVDTSVPTNGGNYTPGAGQVNGTALIVAIPRTVKMGTGFSEYDKILSPQELRSSADFFDDQEKFLAKFLAGGAIANNKLVRVIPLPLS